MPHKKLFLQKLGERAWAQRAGIGRLRHHNDSPSRLFPGLPLSVLEPCLPQDCPPQRCHPVSPDASCFTQGVHSDGLSPRFKESNPKRKATRSWPPCFLICHPGNQLFPLPFSAFQFGPLYKNSEGVSYLCKFTSPQEANHPPWQVLPP